MKKLSILKIFQLTTLALLSLAGIFCLLSSDIKQLIFSNTSATFLFVLVWITLIINFIFILLDFHTISSVKLDFHSLYEAAYSDSLSGMPNRFSCDVLIEKYIELDLPDTLGCIMIELTNLPEINSLYNHAAGNKALKQFSRTLSQASLSLCFIGRNGGNKFLAIFEDCTQKKLDDFLKRVDTRVARYNQKEDNIPIEYKAGTALNSEEHLPHITQLISLANHRIYK